MNIARTEAFKRDYKTIEAQGKNVGLFWSIVHRLADSKPIDETKHPIKHFPGWFSRDYSVKIAVAWYLIYTLSYETDEFILARTGSQTDLYS